MNVSLKWLFLSFFITGTISAANVIGYFTNWGIYENPYTVEDIPYDKLTHIQYAFFIPKQDGTIASSDQWADEQCLSVTSNDSSTSLVYRAHHHNVKVLASVGGWTGSSNFPPLAATAQSRARFCSSACALVKKYGFDGIDIDWEYPCFTDNNGTPKDPQNLVLLLKELRDTLDALGQGHKLITLAIAGSSFHGKNFPIEDFVDYIDFVSVMTYDYTGDWSGGIAWHNSPLYSYGSEDNWSVDKAMKYYTSRNLPLSKINIGMAFYGRSFSGCNGPGMPYTGAGSGEDGEPGMIFFSSINEKIVSNSYKTHWDSVAQVPYCLTSAGEYCSYDDTISIRMKAQYCIKNGFGGAIIWELKAGRTSNGSQPLLDAVSRVLKAPTYVAGRIKQKSPGTAPNISMRNRTQTDNHLQYVSGSSSSVYNLSGRKINLSIGKIASPPAPLVLRPLQGRPGT